MAARLLRSDGVAMKFYKVVGRSIRLVQGVVQLTREQSHGRLHNLVDLGSDSYEITQPIQLKTGEVFGCKDDLSKLVGKLLESVDQGEKIKK